MANAKPVAPTRIPTLMRRRRVLAGIAFFVMGLGLALWFLPQAIKFAALSYAQSQGVEIADLELRFSAAGLRAGKIDLVRATGLRLPVHLNDSDRNGEADPTFPGSPQLISQIPVRRIELEDFELILRAPDTEISVIGSGEADFDELGIHTLALDAHVLDQSELDAELRLKLAADGFFDASGHFVSNGANALQNLVPGTVDFGDLSLSFDLSGTFAERLVPEEFLDAIQRATFDANLELDVSPFREPAPGGPAAVIGTATHTAENAAESTAKDAAQKAAGNDNQDNPGERYSGGAHVRLAARTGAIEIALKNAHLSGPGFDAPSIHLDSKASLTEPGHVEFSRFELDTGQFRMDGVPMRIQIETQARLEYTHNNVSLTTPSCARVRIGPGQLPGALKLLSEQSFCIATRPERPLHLALSSEGQWSAKGAIEVAEAAVDVRDASGRPWVAGTSPSVQLNGATTEGVTALQIATEGGHLRISAVGIDLKGIASTSKIALEGTSLDHETEFSVERLRQLSPEPVINPARAVGRVFSEDDRLRFVGTLSDPKYPISVRVDASHRLQDGQGRAKLSLRDTKFTIGGIQPHHLSPYLASWAQEATGRVAATAELGWNQDRFGGTADLELENISISSQETKIEGINTNLHFDSLYPLRIPAGQSVRFARIHGVLPIENGSVAFGVGSSGEFSLEQAEAELAGGIMVATELPQPPHTGSAEGKAETVAYQVDLTGLDLARLTELIDTEGLRATGTIDGSIPIELKGESVKMAGARLSSTPAGGTIQYRPGTAPPAMNAAGESGLLVMRALNDFHYKRITLYMDGDLDGALQATLELRGSNPEIEDGRPIEFNLNLSSSLAELLRAGQLGTWFARMVDSK